MSEENTSQFLQKYEFRWDVLDSIIGGRSIIDLKEGLVGFNVGGSIDVEKLLFSYGFDFSDPVDKAEAFGYFHESLSLIRKNFLYPENNEGLKAEIPRKILEITDVKELILMAQMSFPGQAKDTQGVLLKKWSCSILKVMHTISFIDKDIRTQYFGTVQQQILDQFYKVLHRDDQGGLYLGSSVEDSRKVPLIKFESKPRKTRDSIILKLLHKSENVAEDIFDQVGVRFIAKDRVSALRVVKFLKEEMIVTPGHVKPSRSRNTLVDIEGLKNHLEQLKNENVSTQMKESVFVEKLEKLIELKKETTELENKHTSEHYRSIQFTCRKLIKVKNPVYDDLKELMGQLKAGNLSEDLMKIMKRFDFQKIQREVKFFYPFEVQIFDEKSFEESEQGRSSHKEYKKAQVLTAMKRVMGVFLDAPTGV